MTKSKYFRPLLLLSGLISFTFPSASAQSISTKRQEFRWEQMIDKFLELRSRRQFEQAEKQAYAIVEFSESAFGEDHSHTATSVTHLAMILENRPLSEERDRETEALLKRALAIRKEKLDPRDIDLAKSFSNLGRLYFFSGNYQKALPFLQRALEINEDPLGGPNAYSLANALHDLAAVYRDLQRYEDAVVLLKREVAVWDEVLGEDNPLLIPILDAYAHMLRQAGRYEKAMTVELRAERVRLKRSELLNKQ